MKNRLLRLKEHLLSLIVISIVGFLLGFFVTQLGVNNMSAKYNINVTSTKDISSLLTYEYFDSTIKNIDEYNKNNDKKISYAKVDYESMLNETKIIKNNDKYTIVVKAKYFPTIAKNSNGQINYGDDRCFKYFKLILTFDNKDIVFNDIYVSNVYNPYLIGSITLGVTFIGFSTFLMIANVEKKKLYSPIPIFRKQYWKESFSVFKKVKNITLIAMLFGLMLLAKLISLPSGFGILGIGVTYLIFSIIAMIFGPVTGVIIGFFSDILGYFMGGAKYTMFFGYTLNAMLAGFTYGICLYKRQITFTKCLYARMVVNLILNVILGSVWWKMVHGLNMEGFYSYLFFISLPKNLIYLLPQSILLYVVLKLVIKPLAHLQLIDKEISENVSLI